LKIGDSRAASRFLRYAKAEAESETHRSARITGT